MTTDNLGVLEQFDEGARMPLQEAIGGYPVTIYGVENESTLFTGHLLLTFSLRGMNDVQYGQVSFNGGTNDDISGFDDLKVSRLEKLIHNRYQIICIDSEIKSGRGYRMGERIRQVEHDRDVESEGISIMYGKPAEHLLFHEVTRKRLVAELSRRDTMSMDPVVFGVDANEYIKQRMDQFLSDPEGVPKALRTKNPVVCERPGYEFSAQLLAMRLVENGQEPYLLYLAGGLPQHEPGNEISFPELDHVIMPGPLDEEAISMLSEYRINEEAVLWLDEPAE